jgi:acyl-CoA dehydrogenase
LRAQASARGDLLIPVVKGCSTEAGIEIASLGVQIHGGMGFIEETGAAQAYRDVRITTIYEGTTAIQSNDFIGRKIACDRGAAIYALIAEMRTDLAAVKKFASETISGSAGDAPGVLQTVEVAASGGVDELEQAVKEILAAYARGPEHALAVSVPMLRLAGYVLGGWILAKAAMAASRRLAEGANDTNFLRGKIASAHFYATHVLPQAQSLGRVVATGAASVLETDAAIV